MKVVLHMLLLLLAVVVLVLRFDDARAMDVRIIQHILPATVHGVHLPLLGQPQHHLISQQHPNAARPAKL